MDQQGDKTGLARRDFLKAATVGAAAVGAVALGAQEVNATDLSNEGTDQHKGYSETDHVAKYYELANI